MPEEEAAPPPPLLRDNVDDGILSSPWAPRYAVWLNDRELSSEKDNSHAITPSVVLGGNLVEDLEGVTHILSIVSRGQRPAGEHVGGGAFARLVLDVEDSFDAPLHEHFDEACRFIDEAVAAKGKCYVHCQLGRSRSATVVIAWLMHQQKSRGELVSLLECFMAVAAKRRISALNYGFFARLCDLEASLSNAGGTLPLFSYFLLQFADRSASGFAHASPSESEVRSEFGRAVAEPGIDARTRALRRLFGGFCFVLEELQGSSAACAALLRGLQAQAEQSPAP